MIAYVLPQWVGWGTIVAIGIVVVWAIWAVSGSTHSDGWVCPTCDALYDTSATLKRHVFERHNDGRITPNEGGGSVGA